MVAELDAIQEVIRAELREHEARIIKILEDTDRANGDPVCRVITEPNSLLGPQIKEEGSGTITDNDREGVPQTPAQADKLDRKSQQKSERMGELHRIKTGLDLALEVSEKLREEAAEEERLAEQTWFDIIMNLGGYEQILDTSKPLNRLVMSKTVNVLSTLVVVLNAVQLGYSSEYALTHPDKPRNIFIDITDVSFCAYYSIELLLRLAAFRGPFFYNHEWCWNWFDAFLVVFSLYEEISKFVSDNTAGGNLANIMRVIRVVKTVKMLRFVHAMHFFSELRHFLVPITHSIRALFWTLLMLGMILYIFAVVFLQGVADAMLMNDVGSSDPDLITYFGSVTATMISLYMAITGGDDWSKYAVLLKDVGLHYYYFFFFYIAFLTFAVLNILTGIFVDSAMQYSNEDRSSSAKELEQDTQVKSEVLKELKRMLTDGSDEGTFAMEDFNKQLDTPVVSNFLDRVDITKNDATVLMQRLTKGKPSAANLETFLDCAIYMKGPARSVHLHEMMAESTAGRNEIMETLKALEDKFKKVLLHHNSPVRKLPDVISIS